MTCNTVLAVQYAVTASQFRVKKDVMTVTFSTEMDALKAVRLKMDTAALTIRHPYAPPHVGMA